ncbi:MAG: hypothetical protein QOG92_2536, partial [Verrucomicrobiota bacterium]|nr:hypothetical protein [Verrucomicrobiota bacterium]
MIWIRHLLVASFLASAGPLSFGATSWEAANEAYQKGKYEEA